jgi:hypothetical protein
VISIKTTAASSFTFARVIMVGYFENATPSFMVTRLFHDGRNLVAQPERTIRTPFTQITMVGSLEINTRYGDQHTDKSFRKYFRPSGKTLDEGLAHAKGYIEACSDPRAIDLDPLCKRIGDDIHAAAVTERYGFKWLIDPIVPLELLGDKLSN